MYHLDTNINTAIEQRANWVRTVQVYDCGQGHETAAAAQLTDATNWPNLFTGKTVRVLVVIALVLLVVVWILLAM